MVECTGEGQCLIGLQINVRQYDISSCIYNCMPVKCPNFLVCGNIAPQCIYNINYGTCLSCRLSFNIKLEFSRHEKCSFCKEDGIVVKRLMCEHKICTNCFQRAYFNHDKQRVCNLCV